jgi:hypothetical protein
MTDFRNRFIELCKQDTDSQCQLFLKSFIFALEGDSWKQVVELSKKFVKYIELARKDEPDVNDLNAAQAADFLQQNGKTRTGTQRREELKDVDLNKDDRISFIEYLMLHYKAMILKEYYKRHKMQPKEDLSNDAIGITGVGEKLLEELFTFPAGLSAELEKAIDDFYAAKRTREKRYKELESVANGSSVKAFAAKNEIAQMDSQDQTDSNRLELTLNAARRKAEKTSGDQLLAAKEKAAEQEEKQKRGESRARLSAIAQKFNQQ